MESAPEPTPEASPPQPTPTEDSSTGAEQEEAKDSPTEPPAPPLPAGITKDEVFNSAKEDAIVNDWGCVKGPPWTNDRLPGMRYGASIEMRPLTMMLPCPCAGGVMTPPHADDGGQLDASGLWHEPQDRWGNSAIAGLPKPVLSMLTNPPPFAPDMEPYEHDKSGRWFPRPRALPGAGIPGGGPMVPGPGAMPSSGPRPEGPTALIAEPTEGGGTMPDRSGVVPLHGVQKAGALKGSFMLPDMLTKTYFPGSEPYSIDYGCVEGGKTAPYQLPGKRWKDTPMWTAIAVPTPCPCALGTFSTFNQPEANHVPRPPDSVFITPGLGGLSQTGAAPWQGGTSYLMGNTGMIGAVLALASSALLTFPASKQTSSRPGGDLLRSRSSHTASAAATSHRDLGAGDRRSCSPAPAPGQRRRGASFL